MDIVARHTNTTGAKRPRRLLSRRSGVPAGAPLVIVLVAALVTDASAGAQDGGTAAPGPAITVVTDNWPRFLGPDGIAVGDDPKLPSRWSRTENIEWATEIPGVGWSSPIVWDDRVFASVTSFSSPFELMKGASEDAQPSTASILWLAG